MKRTVVLLAALALVVGCEKKADEPAKTPTEKAEKKAEPKAEKAAEKKAEQPTSAPAKNPHTGHAGPSGATKDGAKAAGQGVLFAFPDDGAKVFADFPVAFLVMGKTIVPAGEAIDDTSKGHHHVIIDGQPTPKGAVVKADATHIHFGKGQTHTMLKLAPGKHTLTMQFADGAHRSYGPEWAKTINIEVVPNPAKAPKVTFLAPANGATVKSPVKFEFGVEGFAIRPAGEDTKDHTSGHHHLIINDKPTAAGLAVPADKTHIHYGKGQTEAEVELPKGKHTVHMQFADGAHRAYGAYMTSTIEITVE